MQEQVSEQKVTRLFLISSGANSILNLIALGLYIFAVPDRDIEFIIFIALLATCLVFSIILKAQMVDNDNPELLIFSTKLYLIFSMIILLIVLFLYGIIISSILSAAIIIFSIILAGSAIVLMAMNFFLPFAIFIGAFCSYR